MGENAGPDSSLSAEVRALADLAILEELAVHVDGLVERVAPRLVQEAHQREVTAWGRHPAHPVG